MPIHDWTRVDAGIFHHFHMSWLNDLAGALNAGLLPLDYYALAEQIAGGLGPDVLTLQAPKPPDNGPVGELQGAVAVASVPPKVRLTVRAPIDEYTARRRTLVIRHVSRHQVVALIEILSPGNKASRHPLRAFLDKAVAAMTQGIHLLLADLFPPGPRDPQGIQKPLTLASYSAGPIPTAYVETAAVGDLLPDMPLFLTPDEYINVPLERTYQSAYSRVPRFYRAILES